MLKYTRIVLVLLFCLALVAAGGLYYYNYTHEDNTPPSFQSDAELIEVSVKDPDQALLQGLRAYDEVDGDLTDRIRVQSISTLINETDVTVSYIVFDEASNYATYRRTVRYSDYSSPRFNLNQPMIFRIGETITFTNSVSVIDIMDGDISGRTKLEKSTVIGNTPGTYSVELSATNRMGETIYLPLTVQILDNSASRPKIALTKYLVYLKQGSTPNFRRYIAGVTDPLSNSEKEISRTLVFMNESGVDMNTPGVYEVHYYYTGKSGEIATVILTVIVE